MSPTVTYVCCANNDEQLSQLLLPSFHQLEQKGYPVHLLLIDTRQKHYTSAAQAFNTELNLHRDELGEILVFCHQDFAFETDEFHLAVIDTLRQYPNALVGGAGRSYSPKHTLRCPSNQRFFATRQRIYNTSIDVPTEVCSLDENSFALRTDVFFKIRFDERTCFHWHLYAADLGYDMQTQLGSKILVLPAPSFHKKRGGEGLTGDKYFLRTLWRMIRKYHGRVPEIITTCARVSTAYFHGGAVVLKMYFEQLRK